MSGQVLPLILLAAAIIAALALVAKLFWPAPGAAPDAEDPWRQHNELRSPSLESAPGAGHTDVDAAIAAQINGVD